MTDFLDTNVFVYAHDTSDRLKQERALEILDRDDWVISSQVLSQVLDGVRIENPFASRRP